MALVADQRLTRDELSWLLAQEARGAARALRDGVSQLAPPDASTVPPARLPEVQFPLDALDGAIDALSQLQSRPSAPVRRGRIDVAALLFQQAPSARIAIEPGAGTEVYGDERELSRMLHVMLSQSGNPGEGVEPSAPEIRVRRDRDWVRLSVELGPDRSATAELERRWLNRMALRMGGRLELEGGEQALLLPADGSSVQHEVDELRRELEQAKQLGEAYARELAEVFAAGVAAAAPPDEVANTPNLVKGARFDVLCGFAAALARRMRPLLDGIQLELDQIRAKLGEGSDPVVNLGQRYAALREVLGELNRVATADTGEAVRTDAVQVVREVVAGAERRASRHGVRIELLPRECASFAVERPTLTLLLRSLLDHAIAATPRDGKVQVQVGPSSPRGVEVAVRDEGPAVPPRAHDDLLLHRIDPTSIGRPAGVTLIVAHAAAAVLQASMSLGQSPSGGLEVRLVFAGADA